MDGLKWACLGLLLLVWAIFWVAGYIGSRLNAYKEKDNAES